MPREIGAVSKIEVHGEEGHIARDIDETEAIKRCVEAGLGVALIQGIAIEREVTAGTLVTLTLRGGDDSRTYAYARHRRHELSPAAASLIKLLSDTL